MSKWGPLVVVVDLLENSPLVSLAFIKTITDAYTILIKCKEFNLHFIQYKITGFVGYQQ
jgi:hypothetical protein